MSWTDLIYGKQPQAPMPAAPYSPLDTSSPAVISQARQQYPFMAGQALVPTTKQGGEGWPVGETGDPSYPRPKAIPLTQPGAEVGPGSTPADVAGEALHSDPFGNLSRDRLIKSLSPQQTEYLKHESLDYGNPITPEEKQHSMQNAGDSAIRGVLANQWPQKAIQGMNYTPDQLKIISKLDQYMRTPK